ncbi:MAG: thioredoxin [Treponema sp.]|nr:thioredoxin [Treponema sp.]
MVKVIKEDDFKEAVKAGYSVVDFSATWCGPCQMLAPVLENVSEDFVGKVNFFNVDVDEAQDLCQELGIMNVPAIFLFKDGEAVAQSVGFRPKEMISAWISENL